MKLHKQNYINDQTIEGFAKSCTSNWCICGCNCYGPDVLHIGSTRAKNSNTNNAINNKPKK